MARRGYGRIVRRGGGERLAAGVTGGTEAEQGLRGFRGLGEDVKDGKHGLRGLGRRRDGIARERSAVTIPRPAPRPPAPRRRGASVADGRSARRCSQIHAEVAVGCSRSRVAAIWDHGRPGWRSFVSGETPFAASPRISRRCVSARASTCVSSKSLRTPCLRQRDGSCVPRPACAPTDHRHATPTSTSASACTRARMRGLRKVRRIQVDAPPKELRQLARYISKKASPRRSARVRTRRPTSMSLFSDSGNRRAVPSRTAPAS